ncbi:Uncharacterised protein [uncultured Ruminococcus sp.]|nr:Uncharacterised protein [uncultured Ruminococcus sp.]
MVSSKHKNSLIAMLLSLFLYGSSRCTFLYGHGLYAISELSSPYYTQYDVDG